MCNCNATIVVTTHSRICTRCGAEVPYVTPQIQTFQEHPRCSIVASPYSRKQRFVVLLRKVLGVDVGPGLRDKVWGVLANSAPFQDTEDIVSCLKHSNLRSKHYTSLHAFAKLHIPSYAAPTCRLAPFEIENLLERLFSDIEFMWCRHQSSDSFFSYAWLLEKLLRHIDVFDTYSPYLKVLVCPHRREKYERRWKEITKLLPKDSPLYRSDTPPVLPGIALECCA